MRANELRHRITLQKRDITQDSDGGQVTTWANVFASRADPTIAAKIEPLSSRELFAAQAVQSEVTHRITVRYDPALAIPSQVAAMRAVFKNRIFNLSGSANDEEKNRMLVIPATEGLSNG